MDILSAVLFLLIPTGLGYFLVSLICRKDSLPFFVTLMLGYGIGTGLLTHWVVILSFLKIPLCTYSINLPILAFTLLLFYRLLKSNRRLVFMPSIPKRKLDAVTLIFILFILYVMHFIFWCGLHIPICEWDTYSTLGLKAKTIYYSQSLRYLSFIGKFDYPIHLEILLSWLSFCLRDWDDTLIKIIYPMSCLAYVVIQYYFLKFFTSTRWALFSIVLLLSSGFVVYHSWISYRDVTMMFYNCTSILLIVLWYRQKQFVYLYLGAIFSGLTSFIKLEGFGYLGIHNILVWMLMFFADFLNGPKKIKYSAVFGFISLGIYSIFTVYKKIYILPIVPPELINPDHFDLARLKLNLSPDTLFRIKIVLRRYVSNFLLSGNWSLVWFIFFISIIHISRKKIPIEIKALFLVLGLYFSIYLLSYTFTQHYVWIANKEDVLSRSLLHIFPIITILIPLLNTAEEAQED